MRSATGWPGTAEFSRFLLGTLPPEEAQQIAAWMAANPEAAEAMGDLEARDDFVKVLASLPRDATPCPEAERVIRALTRQPSTGPFVPQDGPQLDGFRVVRELGRGGMGVVYEAHDERAGRHVAVKVMNPQLAADEGCRRRFLHEGRAAGGLRCDHVVPIYQVGEVAGVPFLVMPYLEGDTLEGWLRTRPTPVTAAEVMWVATDALAGLAAAHEKGLIHRDVKPSNLWVDRQTGRVLVLDFGLARGAQGEAGLTSPGVVLGTPAYMSPEQARGERTDARTDLCSLGIVLYRMVAGRSPFDRGAVFATVAAAATEVPPPLTGVPPAVRDFVAQLMNHHATRRPADAATALAEAREIQKRLPPAPAPSPWKPRRRLAVAAAFAALAAMLVAGVIVIVIIIRDGRKDKQDPDGRPAVPERTVAQSASAAAEAAAAAAVERLRQLDGKPSVRVRVQTTGYADDSSEVADLWVNPVPNEATGQLLRYNRDKSRIHVLFDSPEKVKGKEVWVLTSKCDVE